MTTDQLSLAVTGLEPDAAIALRGAFDAMFAQAEEWVARAREIHVTSVEQRREMKLARESRLALREIRVKAEATRKRLKEDSLRRGKAIDGIANILKALIEPIEAHLLEQETFAERVEAAERAELRNARAEALGALGADPAAYADLGLLSVELWSSVLVDARAAHEKRIEAARLAELARVEAERVAAEQREKERLATALREAERVERERVIAAENAHLRLEAERHEAEARKAREDAARAVREAQRIAKSQLSSMPEAPMTDRAKIEAIAAALRAIRIDSNMTSANGKAALVRVTQQLADFAAWIERVAVTL